MLATRSPPCLRHRSLTPAAGDESAHVKRPDADLVGGGNEAAFLWDQLLDGVLNGPARPRRAVSVEHGHMIALPDVLAPDAAKAVSLASPAPSGDLADSVAAIAGLDLTASGVAVPGLATTNGEAGDSPGSAGDRASSEAAGTSSSGGYVQVSFLSRWPPEMSASSLTWTQALCTQCPKIADARAGPEAGRLCGRRALKEHCSNVHRSQRSRWWASI